MPLPSSRRHLQSVSAAIALALLGAVPNRVAPSGTQDPASLNRAVDSLALAYQREIGALSSPALEERMSRRRSLQKQGYAEVLHELLARDATSALLSWLRLTAQLEYSIPRHPLALYVRSLESRRDTSLAGRLLASAAPMVMIPLQEDRSFPRNPWNPGNGGAPR